MPRQRAPLALVAVGALLATGVSMTPALASSSTPAGPQPAVATDIPERAEDKITPAVRTRLEAKGSADFWVRFADAPDLAPAKEIADWGERGQFVYDALTSTAKASQAGVVADLKAAGVDYESYWISNAILVEDGTEKLAKQVAASREVKQVHERLTAQLIEPVERKAPTKNAPLAIEWGLDAIHAPEVWDRGYRGDGITVANIDSGVDVEHPALLKHYRGNLGNGVLSNDYNWFDASGACDGAPCDDDAHGTHVMGTMVGDDGMGNRIGVAPNADWIAANGCATCSDADLLASGQWILAPTRTDGSDPDPSQRPHVVNNSWGEVVPGTIHDFMSEEIAAWEAAGIFGAWAAGNAGELGCQTTSSPGANRATYAAGAFTEAAGIARFSSRGPGEDGETKPNLVAPGDEVRSSVPGGRYAKFSGTSMASPHLAGAVALLWSAAPVLVGDIEATKQLLDQTSSNVFGDDCGGTIADNNIWGEGKLDVQALINNAPISGYGFVAGTVTGPDNERVPGARVTAGGRSDTTDAEGTYRLGLEEGSHDLTISAFGYSDATRQVDIVEDETTMLNIYLNAAPTTTVSGTVTDGSGHGWPLDAKVSVRGAPSRFSAWTNPFTGKYSFRVPQSAVHTLVIEPSATGYGTLTQDVEVRTRPVIADVAATVLRECTAAGYTQVWAGGAETFEWVGVPNEWTVKDLAGTKQVWTFDDRFGYGNETGGQALFAEVNSRAYGEGGAQDTTLTSRRYNLSAIEAPVLVFQQNYLADNDFADVRYSINGGKTWKTVLHQTQTTDTKYKEEMAVALPGAGGHSDVRVQFHYGDAAEGGWWQIDNVEVGACAPVDGGFVAGFVKDRNTGDSLNDARVFTGKVRTSTFDPENPTVGRGYYSMFLPKVGERQIRYAAKDYTAKRAPVTVVADTVVRKDVKLAAPLLTVSPGSLTREVVLGGTRSGSFTVTNEGTAPADIEVAPRSSGFETLGTTGGTGVIKGATRNTTEVSTAPSSKRTAPADDGATFDRSGERPGETVTPSAPPSVLADGTTTITHSSSQHIAWGISGACRWGDQKWLRTFTLEDFDIESAFAVTNVSFGVDSVDATTDVTVNLYELDGDFVYSNMTLLGSSVVTLEPQKVTMVDVPVTGTAPAGSTLVVEVVGTDGEFVIGANTDPETAPSYTASPSCWEWEPTELPGAHTVLNVTGKTAVDVPWLDVQPPSFTLEPGRSAKVQVDLDSSRVDQPGTYTSRIIADGGTPYDEPRVGVSLKVTPPTSWGKITGTVTGATCDGETVPLEGAFVVIDGSEYDVTLVTGPDGRYTRWMGISNNRLTLRSSANGYLPESKKARIIKGKTVVHNFELDEFCG